MAEPLKHHWQPSVADLESIRRGRADADAGRTVSVEEAEAKWIKSASDRDSGADDAEGRLPDGPGGSPAP